MLRLGEGRLSVSTVELLVVGELVGVAGHAVFGRQLLRQPRPGRDAVKAQPVGFLRQVVFRADGVEARLEVLHEVAAMERVGVLRRPVGRLPRGRHHVLARADRLDAQRHRAARLVEGGVDERTRGLRRAPAVRLHDDHVLIGKASLPQQLYHAEQVDVTARTRLEIGHQPGHGAARHVLGRDGEPHAVRPTEDPVVELEDVAFGSHGGETFLLQLPEPAREALAEALGPGLQRANLSSWKATAVPLPGLRRARNARSRDTSASRRRTKAGLVVPR